jgi:preprotein translocase subunit Sss1
VSEIKWIFKRTLLFFVTTVGAILIGILGFLVFFGGLFSGKGWAVALGLIIGLVGLFLKVFAGRIDRWWGIKNW